MREALKQDGLALHCIVTAPQHGAVSATSIGALIKPSYSSAVVQVSLMRSYGFTRLIRCALPYGGLLAPNPAHRNSPSFYLAELISSWPDRSLRSAQAAQPQHVSKKEDGKAAGPCDCGCFELWLSRIAFVYRVLYRKRNHWAGRVALEALTNLRHENGD
jgi:hypothetical protein